MVLCFLRCSKIGYTIGYSPILITDAEFVRAHVPWTRSCEGIQCKSNYTEKMAGTFSVVFL